MGLVDLALFDLRLDETDAGDVVRVLVQNRGLVSTENQTAVRIYNDEARRLNDEGLTILLVEQNVMASLKIAHRGYVLENGRIELSGTGGELLNDDRVRQAYLGL